MRVRSHPFVVDRRALRGPSGGYRDRPRSPSPSGVTAPPAPVQPAAARPLRPGGARPPRGARLSGLRAWPGAGCPFRGKHSRATADERDNSEMLYHCGYSQHKISLTSTSAVRRGQLECGCYFTSLPQTCMHTFGGTCCTR